MQRRIASHGQLPNAAQVLLAGVRFAAGLTHVPQAGMVLGCGISEWSCWALEEAMLLAPCRKE